MQINLCIDVSFFLIKFFPSSHVLLEKATYVISDGFDMENFQSVS